MCLCIGRGSAGFELAEIRVLFPMAHREPGDAAGEQTRQRRGRLSRAGVQKREGGALYDARVQRLTLDSGAARHGKASGNSSLAATG